MHLLFDFFSMVSEDFSFIEVHVVIEHFEPPFLEGGGNITSKCHCLLSEFSWKRRNLLHFFSPLITHFQISFLVFLNWTLYQIQYFYLPRVILLSVNYNHLFDLNLYSLLCCSGGLFLFSQIVQEVVQTLKRTGYWMVYLKLAQIRKSVIGDRGRVVFNLVDHFKEVVRIYYFWKVRSDREQDQENVLQPSNYQIFSRTCLTAID